MQKSTAAKSPAEIKALLMQKKKAAAAPKAEEPAPAAAAAPTKEDDAPIKAPVVTKKKVAKKADTKTDAPDAKAEKVKAIKYRHLIFCEPYTQDPTKINDLAFKDVNKLPAARGFKVPEDFYEKLLQAPKKYHNKQGTAFVFGDIVAAPADADAKASKIPKPAKEYKKIAEHTAEAAQTGIIDYDALAPVPDFQAKWEPVYPDFNWNNRANLRKIQKEAPFVLWVGDASEHNPTLYAHFKPGTQHIDSLIVDMGYFYPTATVDA